MYWLPRKKVLVPTDFSEASIDAIHTALAMVEYGRCVHTLHVVAPPPDDLMAEQLQNAGSLEESEATRRKACQKRLNVFLAEHKLDGDCRAVCSGDPAMSITRYAEENDIDLIIMAAHGYEQGRRISIDSVTEHVLHNASCSVLVLRPDGRISGKSSRMGVSESGGFSAVESPSHLVSSSRPR